MSWKSIWNLINMAVFFVTGIWLLANHKDLARGCKNEKNRVFGEGKMDNISETVARFFLIFIGVMFTMGSIIKILYILFSHVE